VITEPEEKRIIFFFPFRGYGGVPVVFLNIAKYLRNSSPSLNIAVVDYADGYMANNVGNSGVELIIFSRNELLHFGEQDLVIFQSLPLWMIPKNLCFSANCKLFFWNLHPLNLLPYIQKIDQFGLGFFKNWVLKYLRYVLMSQEIKTIRLLSDHKSITFMDSSNYNQTCQLQNVGYKTYLPLPVELKAGSSWIHSQLKDREILKLAWIGRIVDFKYHILIHLLGRLSLIQKSFHRTIEFYIVGDGALLSMLKQKCSSFNINIKFIDSVSRDDLPAFLTDIDIGFAMGMSALDFANHGVPTVSLDYSYKAIKHNYRFKWLNERTEFNLAEDITSAHVDVTTDSLQEIIHSVINEKPKRVNESIEYVRKNHSLASVSDRFLNLINVSSLRFMDIPTSLFKMGVLTKILGGKPGWRD
jgi:glycosyltransferase involved in cell wall biosynthesis